MTGCGRRTEGHIAGFEERGRRLWAFDVPWLESAAELLDEPDPEPVRFLVEELVVEGAIAMLLGKYKSGKTWLALELAMAVAAGVPALGRFAVADPGPVMIVLEESGRTALHRRLDRLSRGHALPPGALTELHFAAHLRVRLDDAE